MEQKQKNLDKRKIENKSGPAGLTTEELQVALKRIVEEIRRLESDEFINLDKVKKSRLTYLAEKRDKITKKIIEQKENK